MSAADRRLHLGVMVNGTGSAERSWAWPGTQWNRFNDFGHYLHTTKLARDGIFDAVFLSDHTALQRDNRSRPTHSFDPIVLFAALAALVPDIGFIATASTTYNSPYNLARRLATLDSISGGRLAWNAVSNFNPDVAANFGAAPLPPRAERYRRADEFIEVVRKLWLSWDAPEGEAPADVLWDETTARRIDHHGEFFDVAGPLNVPIGPQGHPVICQAGGSQAGLDLAAKHADLVYAALLHKQAAIAYRAELENRVLACGRPAGSIRILPGLVVVLGHTREEARRRHEALYGASGEDALIAAFLRRTGLRSADPDKPLDPALFGFDEAQDKPVGFVRPFAELTAAEEITPRQLVRRVNGIHRLIVGTPRDVADTIIDWWDDGASDGFNLHIPVLPEGLEEFNREVIPLLQASGAFPRTYADATIRGRLRLADPRVAGTATAGR